MATAALQAGEVVVILPQGTIPRGPAFFDPVLVGKTGVARLAAATGVPVVPVGVWGTEQVWPRSSRVPDMIALLHPPRVEVRVGDPLSLAGDDAVADTAARHGRDHVAAPRSGPRPRRADTGGDGAHVPARSHAQSSAS